MLALAVRANESNPEKRNEAKNPAFALEKIEVRIFGLVRTYGMIDYLFSDVNIDR